MKRSNRRLLYKVQAALVFALYGLHRMLPLYISSAIGGFVGELVGPHMKNTRYAYRNMEMVFPEMPEVKRKNIIRKMWNNLGRTICELPFIASGELSANVEIEGLEHIEELRAMNKPGIFVSAHFGNWEILPQVAKEQGFPLTLVYRSVNNPPIDRLLYKIRTPIYHAMYPKGMRGAAYMMRALAEGGSLAVLIDQKMNSGIEVPFFGRPSMTASAIVELALKYDVPIVMAKVVRDGEAAKFKVVIYKPFFAESTGDRKQDVLSTMKRINGELENWIRENPEMWFWVHRRWGKECYSVVSD